MCELFHTEEESYGSESNNGSVRQRLVRALNAMCVRPAGAAADVVVVVMMIDEDQLLWLPERAEKGRYGDSKRKPPESSFSLRVSEGGGITRCLWNLWIPRGVSPCFLLCFSDMGVTG